MATFVNEEGILHFPEMTHKQLEAMLTEDQRDVELWFCEFVPPELEHQSWAKRHIGNREVYLQECVPRIFDLPEPRSPLERVMRSLFEDLGSTMKALPDRADAVVVDALADKFDRYTGAPGPSLSREHAALRYAEFLMYRLTKYKYADVGSEREPTGPVEAS